MDTHEQGGRTTQDRHHRGHERGGQDYLCPGVFAPGGRRESFAFETTLSGRSYARHIPRWRKAGYHVKLIFLSLPSADLAIARVRNRAAQGGHDVPPEVVRRRFDAGLRNFQSVCCKLVDQWLLYDGSTRPPKLVASGTNA
jgi:predicted ABC-type ATPase